MNTARNAIDSAQVRTRSKESWESRTSSLLMLTRGGELVFALCLLLTIAMVDRSCCAQDNVDGSELGLSRKQELVAERFERLEVLLIQSSEFESSENPMRAALLQKAAALGKQEQVAELLAEAAESLKSNQYTEALERQRRSRETLKKLLELLQSENREQRVREQREEVRRWIEETNRLLRMQGSLRGRTEGGQNFQQSSNDQKRLLDKAEEISGALKSDGAAQDQEQSPNETPGSQARQSGDPANGTDGQESADADTPPETDPEDDTTEPGAETKSDPQPNEDGSNSESEDASGDAPTQNSQDGTQSESESSDASPESQSPNSEGQQSPGSESAPQGQQSEGQQSQGQQSDSNESSRPQSPTERAAERYEAAKQRMQDALEALDDAEREKAIEQQRKAEEELQAAVEELEEILRQLREEEIERSLATLEDRLRRMLEMQNSALEETVRLNEIAGDESSNRQVAILAKKLAEAENKILTEGERAYLLLRDEGSSTAFPEAMEQVNADIANVSKRLSEAKVDEYTIEIETEIVSSLEEMVQALVQIQKENEEKKREQQQQGPSGPQMQSGDQPLVDRLAEIRLIVTLQKRINKRTETTSRRLSDPSDPVGQAQNEELLFDLKELSERQSRIYKVTRNLDEATRN